MRQDKTLLTLPLDLIQLREDEMILLKGGMSRGVEEPNNGCSSNGGSPRVLAGIMGILFGGLGIHKFILGYVSEGVVQLLLSVITCGAAGIIGFIEGIIYLAMDDRKFEETYIRNHRGWF